MSGHGFFVAVFPAASTVLTLRPSVTPQSRVLCNLPAVRYQQLHEL